jgi:hypothetical protein
MNLSLNALSTLAVVAAISALPAQAVQRTFVASFGNDANTATNCGFANPCRGFTAAHSVTDPNGEIVALDAAGYGPVTITKSITITANPGFYAGISASSGNAVTIATAAVKVILRGLNINGLGATRGVSMTSGSSLSVENCVISNFATSGVFVNAAANVRIVDTVARGSYDGIFVQGGASVEVSRSTLVGNTQTGLFVSGDIPATDTKGSVSDSVSTGNGYGYVAANFGGTGTARLTVTRSTASNNLEGILAQQGGGAITVTVSNSSVSGNTYGFDNSPASVFESLGNNTLRGNGTNASGTITPVSGS